MRLGARYRVMMVRLASLQVLNRGLALLTKIPLFTPLSLNTVGAFSSRRQCPVVVRLMFASGSSVCLTLTWIRHTTPRPLQYRETSPHPTRSMCLLKVAIRLDRSFFISTLGMSRWSLPIFWFGPRERRIRRILMAMVSLTVRMLSRTMRVRVWIPMAMASVITKTPTTIMTAYWTGTITRPWTQTLQSNRPTKCSVYTLMAQ